MSNHASVAVRHFITTPQMGLTASEWQVIADESLRLYTTQYITELVVGRVWIESEGPPSIHASIRTVATHLAGGSAFHIEGVLYAAHDAGQPGKISLVSLPFLNGVRVSPSANSDRFLQQFLGSAELGAVEWTLPRWCDDEYSAWERFRNEGDYFLPKSL